MQRFNIVDVVPFRKQSGRKTDFRGALACLGSSPSYALRSFLRPVRLTRSHLRQTLIRQSGFKCSSIEQPNSSTPKERKHFPNFVSAEASGSQVIPIFLLMLRTAPLSSTPPSRRARDTHTMLNSNLLFIKLLLCWPRAPISSESLVSLATIKPRKFFTLNWTASIALRGNLVLGVHSVLGHSRKDDFANTI